MMEFIKEIYYILFIIGFLIAIVGLVWFYFGFKKYKSNSYSIRTNGTKHMGYGGGLFALGFVVMILVTVFLNKLF